MTCPAAVTTIACNRLLGACLTHVRLLRPARSGIFLRSFRLHSLDYARETIAKICSLGAALATAGCAPRP
jgi:hypothetical protein